MPVLFPCPLATGTSDTPADAADAVDSKLAHPTPEVEAGLITTIPSSPKEVSHYARAAACLVYSNLATFPWFLPYNLYVCRVVLLSISDVWSVL